VFGLSVFALVQEERLKQAKQLIFEGEKNISACRRAQSRIRHTLGSRLPQKETQTGLFP
jgi:hypothetical protein